MNEKIAAEADMFRDDPAYILLWGPEKAERVLRHVDMHGGFDVESIIRTCNETSQRDDILDLLIPTLCRLGRASHVAYALKKLPSEMFLARHAVHACTEAADCEFILRKVVADFALGNALPDEDDVDMTPYWRKRIEHLIVRPDDRRAWEAITQSSRGHILPRNDKYPLTYFEPINREYYWGAASKIFVAEMIRHLYDSMVKRGVITAISDDEFASPAKKLTKTVYRILTKKGKVIEKTAVHERTGWTFATDLFFYRIEGRGHLELEGHMALHIAGYVGDLKKKSKRAKCPSHE